METVIKNALDKLDIPSFVNDEEQNSLLRELQSIGAGTSGEGAATKLIQYGLIFESELIQSWKQSDPPEVAQNAKMAYSCWRSLMNSVRPDPSTNGSHTAEFYASEVLKRAVKFEPIPGELGLAFRIAVTSACSESTAEARLLLCRFSLEADSKVVSWGERVAIDVFSAYVYLSRKSAGWTDINRAIQSIDRLRRVQETFESGFLESLPDYERQSAALDLVGLYHLAQIVTLTARYLISGEMGASRLRAQLDRHFSRAAQAFEAARNSSLSCLGALLTIGCEFHVQNSVWTHVAAIAPLREFVSKVSNGSVTSPLIELWPAQQKALQSSFLDPYKTAISVQMPTSAGKTLLAKFAIIQARALTVGATVAYIVPTRALVNQVTRELRRDFRDLGMVVEQAVPAMEIDPTESLLLQNAPDVLVTTPEKLDLLVRDDHAATQKLALVIADEAHNLQDGKRGDRLELLLGVIKRDRPDVRFLLLSPFIPNAQELVDWLGDNRALTPIEIEWRPSRRVVGLLSNVGPKKATRELIFETIDAAHGVDVPAGKRISLGMRSEKDTIESISLAAVSRLCRRGSVLVLCKGKGTATTRAIEVAKIRSEQPENELMRAVCAYIESEVGGPSELSYCLRRGVAYHHAGLSQESRVLIERLICDQSVDVICGTTTLAQGVNFPISSVIVESLQKGRAGKMRPADFWNIAGRAGRAMVDTVGLVAFPAPNKQKREELADFLQKDADVIVSQLMDMLLSIDSISQNFGLAAVRNNEHVSSFLRYLSHAVRVAGKARAADDLEDILRGSLLYHQAKKTSAGLSSRLVTFCRNYMAHIAGSSPGVLTLADRTGFATPSVQYLLQVIRKDHADFQKSEAWDPSRLFGPDPGPLAERIQVISDIPEISLGQSDEANPFSPILVAKILRDWVNGKPLQEMADAYWMNKKATPAKKLTDFSDYLFGTVVPQASWGLGALQGCSLGDSNLDSATGVPFVPSMAFFGVRRKEAVWLRMVGAPRIVAESLADAWRSEKRQDPQSHQELRDWISKRTDSDWEATIPARSTLLPGHLKRIWAELS